MTVLAPSAWRVATPPDQRRVLSLAAELKIPEALASLLVLRGITDPTVARGFLRPSLDELSDPNLYRDLPEAVSLIDDAIGRGQAIMVHGDYDVDGQCATAILTRVLRAAGAKVHPFIPHRLRDGYDFGPAGVEAARQNGVGLIVTCDCGITAIDAVASAREKGMRVIVTDHHIIKKLPPADAVVNPNRPDCESPSKELCGAGVAFKLAQGLVARRQLPENLPLHFLDLVALATVADLVPLTGENRILVRHGLRTLAASRWPGVRALVACAGLKDRALRAGQVGFILAPRLNAVGRIGNAMDGLEMLLTDDDFEAHARAEALEAINRRRQETDREILRECVEKVERSVVLDDTFGLVLAADGWHPGVIGIVASRLVERYARPTIVVGLDGDEGKGSGRSIPGFNLHSALADCAAHLTRFGGHKMAAGLSLRREDLDEFAASFNAQVRRNLTLDDFVRTRRVDVVAPVDRFDLKLERLLRYIEPCGIGNPAPVFAVERAEARGVRTVGEDELHVKFKLHDDTGGLSAIGFGLLEHTPSSWFDAPINVAFRLESNEWQGESRLQARVLDVRPAT